MSAAIRLTAVVATVAGLAFAASCRPAQTTTTPATSTGTTQAPAPVERGPGAVAERPMGPPPGGAPGDTTRPRRRPDPRAVDSMRAGMLTRMLGEIAGRENEPAGKVFKNVQVLKDVPAGQFLRTMHEQYGRALTWGCSNCHVPGQWDSDEKKNKKIARDMQKMTNQLNAQLLPAIPALDQDFEKVACVTCHRGSGHPANTMPVPAPGAAAPGGPGAGGPPR